MNDNAFFFGLMILAFLFAMLTAGDPSLLDAFTHYLMLEVCVP